MRVVVVDGGRGNSDFHKRLEAYSDDEYDLINVQINHGGRYVAFLKEKAQPKRGRKASKPDLSEPIKEQYNG